MDPTNNPKQLIVEGHDDLHSVVGLMKAHVDWADGRLLAPVYIHIGNGAPEILKKEGLLTVVLKSSALTTGGVMLDADSAAHGKYERIRNLCIDLFPDIPAKLPLEGLVVDNADHKRFGVWIMPDNSSDGILETFLKYLVPAPRDPLWSHAEQSVQLAKGMGCPCRDSHIEKANLYTWLAWQDPPGQSPGIALTRKALDPHSPSAASFVAWFTKLYQLPPKSMLFA
ncbi:MAG: DUF3226 domain-containing protein [Terracidiphilus sp.]